MSTPKELPKELPWINQSNVNAFNQAEADYSTDFDGDQDVSLIEIVWLLLGCVGKMWLPPCAFRVCRVGLYGVCPDVW